MEEIPKSENPNSPSHNIFKSLFGESLEDSIFSDSNQFRTKPTIDSQSIPQKLQEILQLDIDSPVQIPNFADHKSNKRKRNENSPHNLDPDDSEIEIEVKKSKLGTGFASESSERSKSLNLDEKKRKRGDVEAEFEERKCGGLNVDFKEVEGGKGKIGPVSKSLNIDKKKRKRGDVEAEYEGRKYGGLNLDIEEVEGGNWKIGEKRKKIDEGEDLLVPKEGFDDEEKLLRTVLVGNLPLKVKKKALLREFNRFGEIESVRIRSVPLLDDKTPRKGAAIKQKVNDTVDRVNAYVVFKTEDSAQALLSHNMAVVGGNHIHVDRACPPRKKLKGENALLYDSKRTIFFGNLPFDVKDEELYQLFAGFNNLKDSIEAIRVVRDPGTSLGRGIAYVLFNTREAADTVVRKHNLKMRDRELRLSHATKPNLTPSKRKVSSSPDDYNPSAKKPAVDGSTSYQGVQASKSGVQKKNGTRIAKPITSETKSPDTPRRKQHTEKRPSVAARKAAEKAAGDGGHGKKRKPESRTPESNSRKKKARKFT